MTRRFKCIRQLGPGLLESVYQQCLAHELKKRGLQFGEQVPMPVVYDGIEMDAGFRLDFFVEECVVVELKAVEEILPIHQAQLLTYMKLSGCRIGLLINFNVAVLKDGVTRLVL